MLYTIKDVRTKLGKIMRQILNEEINNRYNSITPLYPVNIAFTCDKYVDELVIDLSDNLKNSDYCKNKLLSLKSEYLFTFFIRYHLLSSALSDRDQTLPANLPDEDKTFFIILMNQMWKTLYL